MTRHFLVVLMIVFAGEIGFAQEKTDTAASMANEVFLRRIGTWDTQVTIKPGVWVPDGLESKGVETIDWALGKKFVKGQKQEPGNVESMFLETYDDKDRVFRSWYFDSNGGFPRGEMVGRWDSRTKTMTYKGIDPTGAATLVVIRLGEPDLIDWNGTWRDKDGKVVMEIKGRSTRRK